jgi:hypothetical protein
LNLQRLNRYVLVASRLQVGKELTVEWTSKDERACANGSNLKLRNFYLMKFIPKSHMFMLRYRCGFEKIVDATSLVLLIEESIVHVGSNKKKMRNLVSLAEAEVLSTRNRQPATLLEQQEKKMPWNCKRKKTRHRSRPYC